jgi:ParB family chromosome partitioning protein
MSQKVKQRLAMLNQGAAPRPLPPADEVRPTSAATVVAPEAGSASPLSPRRKPLANRENTLGRIATGKQRMVQTLLHPPARIRMWEGHNRDYARLSEARCKDLIEGFRRAGRQEFPAIVRKLDNDDSYDYELICGARRHWTATFLEWELLVEVRELSDRAAFILQDIENRDREDISDYERAQDYMNALPLYFENNQSQMAKFLEIDKSNFGKLLELTKLPEPIVAAYEDIRELKTHHGTAYRQLLADKAAGKRVLERAKSLATEPVSGKVVMAELRKAAEGKPLQRRNQSRQFGAMTLVRKSAEGKLAIDCQLPDELNEAAIQALQADFKKMLTQLQLERQDEPTPA